nr:glycosyltransferase [Variovorax sp. S12S4]
MHSDLQRARSVHASSGRARCTLRGRPGIPRQPPAGPRGARGRVLSSRRQPAARAALSAGRQRLGRQGHAQQRALCRPRLHRRPQRIQPHAHGRAQREPRQHGALRFFAGHARVRGGRFRRLPDHRCVGGHRAFLEPGKEVLVAADGEEVAAHVRQLDAASARRIGEAAYRRVLAEHTYAHRAAQLEALLEGRDAAQALEVA